jgi:hypothetical protein
MFTLLLILDMRQSDAGANSVKQVSNIMAFTMMLVVLVLGVFMASTPDFDDGDDNVGCAAVMPLAPRKSVRDVASDEPRVMRSERSQQGASSTAEAQGAALEVSALGSPSLSQISPPLRA